MDYLIPNKPSPEDLREVIHKLLGMDPPKPPKLDPKAPKKPLWDSVINLLRKRHLEKRAQEKNRKRILAQNDYDRKRKLYRKQQQDLREKDERAKEAQLRDKRLNDERNRELARMANREKEKEQRKKVRQEKHRKWNKDFDREFAKANGPRP